MKIITKCVIDMTTLQTIEEEFYFHEGPVAKCKGGGGSSSGKVGFPAYMETLHGKWLDSTGTDTLTMSMVDAMETAHGSSPWASIVAFDPDNDIAAWESALTAYKAILTGISEESDWATLYAQADTTIDAILEADIAQSISDYADQLDDEIEMKVLPRFRRGMQDINAVVSSAFPIGEALIEVSRNKDVAKHGTTIRATLMDKKPALLLAGTEHMLKMVSQTYGLEEAYARTYVEGKRLKIVAKGEQVQADGKYDESDALWDMEVFQHGSNLLGAIGGGVVKPKQASQMQSALGGAMTGAAAGAKVAGGWGAVVGGILGAASAFL